MFGIVNGEFQVMRAISFDGGGIRGIFQVSFLKELAGLNLIQQVDLLAGTSTGAIIAAGLSIGLQPAELCELYESLGAKIFGKRMSWIRMQMMGASRYSSGTLKQLLKGKFPPTKKLGDCAKRLLVPATRLNDRACCVFDSSNCLDLNIPLLDVILASTAAPLYFSPHFVSCLGTSFVDGGLTCNNPGFACIQAFQKDGCALDSIKLLSIANGTQPPTEDGKEFDGSRPTRWLFKLVPLCMDVSSDSSDRMCRQILPKPNYIRVELPLKKPIPLDDYKTAFDLLPGHASIKARELKDEIKNWLVP